MVHRMKRIGFNAIKESFDLLPTAVCFLIAWAVLFSAIGRCIS